MINQRRPLFWERQRDLAEAERAARNARLRPTVDPLELSDDDTWHFQLAAREAVERSAPSRGGKVAKTVLSKARIAALREQMVEALAIVDTLAEQPVRFIAAAGYVHALELACSEARMMAADVEHDRAAPQRKAERERAEAEVKERQRIEKNAAVARLALDALGALPASELRKIAAEGAK